MNMRLDKCVKNYFKKWWNIKDCYKNQEMCNKEIDNYSECLITQEMSDKAVNRCFFVFDSIPDLYKTQEMCDRVASEDPFLIVCYRNIYKIQRMCEQAVDDSLAALTLIPDWFVTSKMIKKLDTAFYTDENILYFDG